MLETQQISGCLVGDGGYACRRYMLTPLNTPTTAPERVYNSAQILARNCIERTIGKLKHRFPALKYGLRLKLLHSASERRAISPNIGRRHNQCLTTG